MIKKTPPDFLPFHADFYGHTAIVFGQEAPLWLTKRGLAYPPSLGADGIGSDTVIKVLPAYAALHK